jgi:hypothetical protein
MIFVFSKPGFQKKILLSLYVRFSSFMSSNNNYNITISDYSEGEENKELHENLPQSHTNFDGYNIFLKIPEPQRASSYRTRKSTVSKVSVEEFLKKLEKTGQNFTPRNFNEILKHRNGRKNDTIYDKVIHFLHSQHFYTNTNCL